MTFTSTTTLELGKGRVGREIIRGTAQTGDTYKTKLGSISQVIVSDETTLGGARATWSGRTITITCTNSDVVTLDIHGVA